MKLYILLLSLFISPILPANELFRTMDILDPRILGGDFVCNEESPKDNLEGMGKVSRSVNRIFENNLGDESYQICLDYDPSSRYKLDSLRVIAGYANNLQYNSYLSDEDTNFGTLVYNHHNGSSQHTVSGSVFYSGDNDIIADYRIEYAYGKYSMTKSKANQTDQLHRTQWYTRVEGFENNKELYELGVRGYVPALNFNKVNFEFDYKYRKDIDRNSSHHMDMSYFLDEFSRYKFTARFNIGIEEKSGNYRSSYYRAEIARKFRLSKYYVKVFVAPTFSDRTNEYKIESGILIGRLFARKSNK